MAELKALQAKVNQLNAALGQQEQELKQLRQAARQDADARAEVAHLKQNLQENLQATEQMQQDLAAATAVKADNSKDNGRLQQALDKSLQQSSALQKQLDVLAKSHSDNNQESKVLLAELNDSRKQNEGLQNQLVAVQRQAGKHQLENSVLQQQLAVAALQKEELEPKSAEEIRDYAIGSALAQDMLALLKERAAQGIDVDNRLALAGVKDTFAGKPKLQQAQIEKALDATEVVLSSNQQQQKLNTETAGSRYIEQFKNQKQVKKDASGYFYLVDSIGKGRIDVNSIVTVVVKESLANGKVIKDMDAAGTSITQPLSSFPRCSDLQLHSCKITAV
ncbi:FKBP-type peptidyl-prolyl cis-trans isomerase N-terminal domain-containing protein [Serratia sp. L9]|uniref:FKBP-type peptidyl-prolyl cis-trans isomerase N-terminal domain-containing protein n=1 Tax=Serratia sp. L9 TaxID=3423946 RepID=UPI003D66A92A